MITATDPTSLWGDSRLQQLLNAALARRDYTEVARIMAQANHEVIERYNGRCLCKTGPNAGKPHEFKTVYGDDLWPQKCACVHCDARTPIEFCRSPMTCRLAGRCTAEYACND